MKRRTLLKKGMVGLVGILLGCNDKGGLTDGKKVDLSKYRYLGSTSNMTLYTDNNMSNQDRYWAYGAAAETEVWFNLIQPTTTYIGPDIDMNFGPPNGNVILVANGQSISIPPTRMNSTINCVITENQVWGNGPMGNYHHYRGVVLTKRNELAIIVALNKPGKSKACLDGLYSMQHFVYNSILNDRIPKDQIPFHKFWAEAFVMDNNIAEQIRRSR